MICFLLCITTEQIIPITLYLALLRIPRSTKHKPSILPFNGQYTRRTVVRGELARTRANSSELARTPREFAIGSPTLTLRQTPANVRRSAPNVRRSSAEFARVRPSSPVLRRELANGSPENSFAGGKPSTSNERSPRTGPPRTTFADGELQFAKKHILDGVNDRSPRTVVRQRRTSSLGEIKF